MELGELEPDEAAVFMEELGIHGSGLDRIIALSYTLLGLISFLTAGPDEVRAWPIPDGSSAVDAAGAIHTDLAKGFIRAETVSYEDLSRSARWPRRASTAGCAPRARPTRSATATCWRSSSASRPVERHGTRRRARLAPLSAERARSGSGSRSRSA